MLTWEEIRKQLKERNWTNKKLAARWRIAEPAASRFTRGQYKSQHLKELLARLLEIEVTDIPDPERCPVCKGPWKQSA